MYPHAGVRIPLPALYLSVQIPFENYYLIKDLERSLKSDDLNDEEINELVIPSTLSRKQVDEKLKLLEQGTFLLENKEPEKAIDRFDKLLLITPKDFSAWYNRGLAYGLCKNYDEAISSYEKSLTINPNYVRALHNKSDLHNVRKEFDLAINCMKRCIEIEPDDDHNYVILGNAYLESDLDLAQQQYETATHINPDSFAAWNNLGSVLKKKGLEKDALNYYKRAVKLDPNFYDALANMATLYRKMGNLEMYEEFSKRALKAKNNLKNDWDYRDSRRFLRGNRSDQ